VAADAHGNPFGYRKAGVMLADLRPAGTEQTALFAPVADPERLAAQARLMATVDRLNRRFGRRTVGFASMGPLTALRRTRDGTDGAPRWEMRREQMSPRYTTRWEDLASVVCRDLPPAEWGAKSV
jgi:DNA polymerase V